MAILTTALREHLHEFVWKLPNIHTTEELYRRKLIKELKNELHGQYSYFHYVLNFTRKEINWVRWAPFEKGILYIHGDYRSPM